MDVDYTVWGWTHLFAGTLVAAAGLGLVSGAMWARILGVGITAVSLMVSFTFIAAYPVWSAILIALDVLVIMAIVAHGRELQDL